MFCFGGKVLCSDVLITQAERNTDKRRSAKQSWICSTNRLHDRVSYQLNKCEYSPFVASQNTRGYRCHRCTPLYSLHLLFLWCLLHRELSICSCLIGFDSLTITASAKFCLHACPVMFLWPIFQPFTIF